MSAEVSIKFAPQLSLNDSLLPTLFCFSVCTATPETKTKGASIAGPRLKTGYIERKVKFAELDKMIKGL